MKISKIHLYFLNATCDDYESIETIKNEVSQQIGHKLSDLEANDILDNLVFSGLVDAYIYDVDLQKYQNLVKTSKEVNSKWFFITSTGRKILDEMWED